MTFGGFSTLTALHWEHRNVETSEKCKGKVGDCLREARTHTHTHTDTHILILRACYWKIGP